jgi:hypothetical protein
MAYTPSWERLSEALTRVVEACGLTQNDAKADICRAIADGAVTVRAKLGRHTTKSMTGGDTVLEGSAFQIPTRLKPEELDWQESRPLKPWPVRREAFTPVCTENLNPHIMVMKPTENSV